MQLSPRYEGTPVLSFDPVPSDPAVPVLRQRRRLADTLATFDETQWSTPSRCADWSCRDVVSHLVTVNAFWATSVAAGRRGEPTRFLGRFDPVATSAALVSGAPDRSDAELLDSYVATTESMAQAFADLDPDGWTQLAEAPPGHVTIAAVALHALWDGWIHERDIALPLGLGVAEEPDEVAGSLRYVVGLGAAFLATTGSTRVGAFTVHSEGPDLDLMVDIRPEVVVGEWPGVEGLPACSGSGPAMVEAFSLRTAPPTLPDPDAWMIAGLATVFDQAV